MKKKTIIILGIILIIFASLIIYYEYPYNSVKVGNTYFSIPQGYKETYTNGNSTNIIHGNNSIGIIYYNDGDILTHINNYTKMKKNDTIKTTERTINNITVYKSNIKNDVETAHYWFINENKVFEICSWHGDSNTDYTVQELIKSMRTFV